MTGAIPYREPYGRHLGSAAVSRFSPETAGDEVEPQTVFDCLQTLVPNARLVGRDQSWAAPVSYFNAPEGFGENLWGTTPPMAHLSIRLTGAEITFEGRCRRSSVAGGAFALQPVGSSNHYIAHGPVTFAHLNLSDTLLDRAAEGFGTTAVSGRLRDDLLFPTAPRLEGALRRCVLRALDRHEPVSALEMEALTLLVLDLLFRLHEKRAPKRHVGGLASWQVRRVCNAMDERLGRDLTLDELASIAGLSPTHFSRAFKQAMGVSPFQWLRQRRVDRAMDLLASGALPIAEVALAVGFSAQPEFTTAFKRATGVTPGAWRRERLS